MDARLGSWRSWQWATRLLLVVALAQACGGDGSKSTGPSGGTEITLALKGVEASQLAQGCTGTLTASRPGFAPRSARIPPDGRVTLSLTPGEWTFTVEIVCQKAGGPQTFTSSVNGTVGGGGLTLNFPPVAVNSPPSASANCSPSFVNPGVPSSCSCSFSDADPGDVVSASWGASGGTVSPATGPSTEFSSGSPGTFDVTCTVRDNRGGVRSASSTVTVGQLFTLTVNMDFLTGSNSTVVSNPPGITCVGTGASIIITCSAQFAQGTAVALTATPVGSASFDGWTAGPCPFSANPCTLTMTGNISVTAEFD